MEQDEKNGKTRTLIIPISKLEVCPHNPRKTEFDLTELVESIKSEEVKEVIEVHPFEDKYHVLAGQRRFLAAKEAGKKELECLIYPLSENQAEDWCMKDAFHKKEYNPMDIAKLSIKAVEKYGSISEASKQTGISESKLKKYNALRGLVKAVVEKVGSQGTNCPSLETLGKISSLPQDRQIEALSSVEGKTRSESAKILGRLENNVNQAVTNDKKIILVPIEQTAFCKLSSQAKDAKQKLENYCAKILESEVEN